MVNSTSYQPPLDKLLTLGNQQLNYVAELGFGSEHILDLIKLAVDKELLDANVNKEGWAPVHAWRILGELQATDAVVPLIQLFHLQDNDLVNEELPKVYGKIGLVAIPELTKYLNSQSNQLLARVTAINSLEEIAQHHPDARDEIVTVLTKNLQSCNQNPSELNGFIVSALINLQAQEAAPVIKYAFNTNQVAEDIVGNWEEVRQNLGISSDEDVQEFEPQASEEVTNTETVETPALSPDITQSSTPDVEQASEDQINALIDLVVDVNNTQTPTEEDTLPTTELVDQADNAQLLIKKHEENLTNEINKIEAAFKVNTTENAQVTIETSTQVRNLNEQINPESIEAITVETSGKPNSVQQEDNKGFGRPVISKEKSEKPEKAKPNKKKKRGFSDL